MNRTTALILAGVSLLAASAIIPLVGLATTQWDTDYVYTVEANETYCTGVVHESPNVEGTDDYRVDYENLSATGRQHFDRALADGQYVVEEEADIAPDFQFTDGHVAAGEGCYAVSYEGDTHALRTVRESQRVGPVDEHWFFLGGGLLLVLGSGSVIAGVGLGITRRLR